MHGCKSGGSGIDESIYFALQKHDCAAAWAFPRLSAHVGYIPGLGTLFVFEFSRGKPTLQGCCPIARLRPSYQNRKNLVDGKYFACIDLLPIQEGGIDGQAGDTYTQSFGPFWRKDACICFGPRYHQLHMFCQVPVSRWYRLYQP